MTEQDHAANGEVARLAARVESLERTVAELTARLDRAPAVAAAPRPGAAYAPPTATPASPEAEALREFAMQELMRERLRRPAAIAGTASPFADGLRRSTVTVEQVEGLVGRYGMLVLATAMALAAVGTFLGWAISRDLLSPPARVALGVLAAVAVGVFGFRLRRRERSFGDSLLGLALAILHVCAYAAGPSLGIVPPQLAFAVATLASVALALFAHRERDEPLWCVGFGGAALAPFVTGGEDGSAPMLAAYGTAVLLAGGWALRGRSWRVAARVFAIAGATFVAALAAFNESSGGPLMALALPLVVAAGVAAFAHDAAAVRGTVLSYGLLAAAAALRVGMGTDMPFADREVMLGIAAAAVAWLALQERVAPDTEPPGNAWAEGAAIPLAFLLAAVLTSEFGREPFIWACGAGAGLLVAALARRQAGAHRDWYALAASIAALGAVWRAGEGQPLVVIASVAALAVALLLADRAWQSGSWVAAAVAMLAVAGAASVAQVSGRTAYAYTPFATRESAAALAVGAAFAVGAVMLRRGGSASRDAAAEGAAVLGGLFAFGWGHQELGFAFSERMGTLLRISYYAAWCAFAVGLGRSRGIAWLRHVGLALGLVAAGTAFRGASRLDAVGARIGAYLVVAVFLLGVAYWYRRPGPDPEEAEAAAAPSGADDDAARAK